MKIDRDQPKLSLRCQCRLLSLSRSSLYYTPVGESAENLAFMRLIRWDCDHHPSFTTIHHGP